MIISSFISVLFGCWGVPISAIDNSTVLVVGLLLHRLVLVDAMAFRWWWAWTSFGVYSSTLLTLLL